VIGRWRPAFLILPDEMNAESMADHIRISLVVGPILGIVVILLGSLLSYFWFG
jgi:cation transporter-like permease